MIALFAFTFLLFASATVMRGQTFVPSFIFNPSCAPGQGSLGSICMSNYSTALANNITPFASQTPGITFTNGSTEGCFYGLNAGSYTFSLLGNNSVVYPGSLTVPSFPQIFVSTSFTDEACGQGNGTFSATPTGGSTYGFSVQLLDNNLIPIGSAFTNVTPGATVTFNNLSQGAYHIKVQDGGCTCNVTMPVNIGSINFLPPITPYPATCTAPCNGYISVDLSTAIAPVSINWTGPVGGTVSGITADNYTISGLCEGIYTVTVDDASSCGAYVSDPIVVGEASGDTHITSCISSGLVWNSSYWGSNDITLAGNLIIAAGACLTIENMTIRLQPGKTIQVLTGAKLIANNSTFDAGCGDLWGGFRISSAISGGIACGTSNSQALRGDLTLSNCLVTRAYIGITNYSATGNSSGGRITAFNTELLNNWRDMEIQNYSASTVGTTAEYGGYFEGCTFNLTSQPSGPVNFVAYRIRLTSVNDVRFKGCSIINTVAAFYAAATSYGIYALTSRFQWIGEGVSEINGIRRGIWATGSSANPNCTTGMFSENQVTGTTFRCHIAVYMDKVLQCSIIDNTILPKPSNFSPNNGTFTGIQIQNSPNTTSTLFYVIHNTINYTEAIGATNVTGVLIDNCKGQSSYILRNSITACGVAIDILNKNRNLSGADGNVGVHFECNDFHGCTKDIETRSPNAGFTAESGVAGIQAMTWVPFLNPLPSASNDFSDSETVGSGNVQDDIRARNGDVNGFTYYYNNLDFNLSQLDVIGPREISRAPGDANSAPYNIVEPSFILSLFDCDGVTYEVPSLAEIQSSAALVIEDYNNLKSIYNAMVDGGNTDELRNNVLYSEYSAAWQLYQVLISNSPALSEEVMIAAIEREYTLPASLLTLILSANPSAAKSAEILHALENRENPLDAYQMAQVTLGYYNSSPKEILEQDLGNYRTTIEQCIVNAMRNFNERPSQEELDILDDMLDEENIFEHRRMLAELHMRFGDFNSGYHMLQNLASHFDLKPELGLEYYNYAELLKIQHNVVNRDDFHLTTSEIAFLQDIYNNDRCNLGSIAYMLLETYAAYPKLEDDAFVCLENRSMKLNNGKSMTTHLSQLSPNPASNLSVLKLNMAAQQVLEVAVIDMAGRTISKEKMQIGQIELPLEIVDLSDGVYTVVVSGKGISDQLQLIKQ